MCCRNKVSFKPLWLLIIPIYTTNLWSRPSFLHHYILNNQSLSKTPLSSTTWQGHQHIRHWQPPQKCRENHVHTWLLFLFESCEPAIDKTTENKAWNTRMSGCSVKLNLLIVTFEIRPLNSHSLQNWACKEEQIKFSLKTFIYVEVISIA